MGMVLVVDDDVDLNVAIQRALNSAGHEVVAALNGREAMAVLRNGLHPSVMLLDLVMPIMNGWEVLDLFARHRDLQKIPVVLMSARFGNRFVDDPYTILRKPFALDQLLVLVEYHCRPMGETPDAMLQEDQKLT